MARGILNLRHKKREHHSQTHLVAADTMSLVSALVTSSIAQTDELSEEFVTTAETSVTESAVLNNIGLCEAERW